MTHDVILPWVFRFWWEGLPKMVYELQSDKFSEDLHFQ